jgi:hypothetical protein
MIDFFNTLKTKADSIYNIESAFLLLSLQIFQRVS